MKAIVTGGLGFIGFNFFELFRSHCDILVVDKKSYCSNPEAEKAIPNLRLIDICSEEMFKLINVFEPDVIFNFAAESHVDRSILDPMSFLRSNVEGTLNLLEAIRTYSTVKKNKNIRLVQVSTDEVYGSLGDDGSFTEKNPLQPNSPYSASKAAADHFVRAYGETYQLDTVITRCSNNYGPWQFPEKLMPLMICHAVEERPLPVYGTGLNVRDWIYVEDHCRGIMAAAQKGVFGEVYNFGGRSEKTNLEVVKAILKYLKKPESLIRFVEDRKGHDFRYAIDCSKAQAELAWNPTVDFYEGLKKTIDWNLEHRDWLDFVRSDQYQAYYRQNYEKRV